MAPPTSKLHDAEHDVINILSLQPGAIGKPQPNSFWNSDLIERYDLGGPRYTSYPTALQFDEAPKLKDIKAAIARGNQSLKPLSLYFHIPFCDTICYYCACNKIVTGNKDRAIPYLERLNDEIALYASVIDKNRPVSQLHWGGGTPTFISNKQMTQLMETTRKHFNLVNDDEGEYSVEVHPGRLPAATVRHLRDIGFNRLSMGVQDFNPDTQKAVNRFNTYRDVWTVVDQARQSGFHSISMDLIYGLPYQSVETLHSTLTKVIALSPDRLSLFSYAHMPERFKTQRQIDSASLPSAREKLAMLEYAIGALCDAGYVYIGMDHFAKPQDELTIAQKNGELQRNFQGYATRGNCDLVGFGVSSISMIDNIYMQNHKTLDEYNQAIDTEQLAISRGVILNDDDQLRRTVIQKLTCNFSLDFEAIDTQFKIEFESYFAKELSELKAMIDDGLAELQNRHLKVTDQGRLLIRRICMIFDAYFEPNNNSYSKII